MYSYGVIEYQDAAVGSRVRYVPGRPGHTGAVMRPRNRSEENAVLLRVNGSMGYVQLLGPSAHAVASSSAEGGSASAFNIKLPISARGGLRVE